MEVKTFSTAPLPIYYKGWIIQPMWDGSYEVYPRTDTRSLVGRTFDSLPEAMNYVESQNDLEEA